MEVLPLLFKRKGRLGHGGELFQVSRDFIRGHTFGRKAHLGALRNERGVGVDIHKSMVEFFDNGGICPLADREVIEV